MRIYVAYLEYSSGGHALLKAFKTKEEAEAHIKQYSEGWGEEISHPNECIGYTEYLVYGSAKLYGIEEVELETA